MSDGPTPPMKAYERIIIDSAKSELEWISACIFTRRVHLSIEEKDSKLGILRP